MSGGEFIDTNVLIYAHDSSAGVNHQTALALVSRLFEERSGAASVQVFAEFYSATARKRLLPPDRAEEIVADYIDWNIHRPTLPDVLRASQLYRRYQMQWWDAMILNSAIQLGCHTLWTEDLQDGQQFGPVTVRNPFAA